MSGCNNISVNKTFIIEPLELTGGSPTLSACTTMYTNLVESCSGDTSIQLGTGLILFSGNSQFSNISASTIEATTYLSGGTNILDIINLSDTFVTGGTFNDFTDSIQLTRNDGVNIIITGLTDFYTTGASLYNNVLYFDRTDTLSAYTVDLSTLVVTDTYLTGATYDKNTGILGLTRNDDVTIFTSGITDYYVTAGTYNTLTESIDFSGNNQATTFSVDVSALIDDTNTFITGFTYDNSNNLTIVRNDGTAFTTNISVVSGLTVNGDLLVTGFTNLQSVSATTISGVVFYGDGSNLTGIDNFYTTGVTIYNNVAYFDRNDVLSAYTLTLSGFSTNDIYVTSGTVNGTELTLTRNDNVNILITGFSSDIYTTGSTLIGNIAYFDTNNVLSAYTLDLTSLAPSGGTDYYTTGTTVIGNTIYFNRNDTLSAYTVTLSGLSASTDYYTTGATVIGDVVYFDRNDTLSAYTVNLSGISVTGSAVIRIHGSRNRNNNNNIFLRYDDGVPYNVIPYRVYADCEITDVVASSSSLDTWDAYILTGTSVVTDSIYFLHLESEDVKYDNSVNINVTSGDTLYLYMSGSSIDYPTIDVYLRKI